MITSTTSQVDYLRDLRDNAGDNAAIIAHAKKVEAMNAQEWEAHRAKLIELHSSSVSTVRRLVRSVKK